MSSITRTITVTRKGMQHQIQVVEGTSLLPISVIVSDYDILSGSAAVAYNRQPNGTLVNQACTISENTISFTPPEGFYLKGYNKTQVRVTNNNRNLFSFVIDVWCDENITDDADVEEINSQPTLVTQLLSQIGVLTARMDTFSELPEGSTTSDAALNDIRIGYDGTEYQTPGDAVRGQVGSLSEDLGYTNDSVIEFLKGAERIVKTNWTQGRIDKNTGNFGISGSEIVTDYIQCHGDEIIIKTLKPNYTIYKFKYDLDGTYIESDIGNYPKLRITNDGYKYRFQANSINSVEIPTPENITSIVTINENLNLPYALKNQFWDNKKTEDISYANLGNYSVSPDGAATSPAPDKIAINFDAVKDERYVFTISEGYYFILGYNGFQTKHNRKVLILASPITGKLRMAIGKTDGSNFSDLDECKFTAQKMVFRNNSHEYDFIIAGKNATSYHKSISDVVCDGTNDEDLLTACCNGNILVSQHTKILVYGDICINKFVECYNGLIKGRGFNAIQIQMSHIKTDSSSFYDQHHIVSLNGINNFNNSGYHSKIYVTENCYNTISPTKEDEYSIIGGIRQQSTSSMGDYWFKLGLEINNIDVSPYGLEKPICCIDGSGFSEMRIDGVQVRPYITATIRHGMYNVPDGLIGIRGIHGSNIGCNNYIKRTRIIGMYEGLALTGEHFICEDILMHTCVYGLTIGNYKVTPEMQHPNVFIGCSIEQCKRFGILNRYGATEESEQKYGPLQTVIMIGTSTEPNYTDIDGVSHDTLPFKEIVKGVYSGRIEMDKFTNGRIFEDESGRNILCVNTKHGICGEFNSRPKSSNSEFGAKYYAIDNNTMWEMTHSGWKQIN